METHRLSNVFLILEEVLGKLSDNELKFWARPTNNHILPLHELFKVNTSQFSDHRIEFVRAFLGTINGLSQDELEKLMSNPNELHQKLALRDFEAVGKISRSIHVPEIEPSTLDYRIKSKLLSWEDRIEIVKNIPKTIPGSFATQVDTYPLNLRLRPDELINELGGHDYLNEITLSFSQIIKVVTRYQEKTGIHHGDQVLMFFCWNTANEISIVRFTNRTGYSNYRVGFIGLNDNYLLEAGILHIKSTLENNTET